MNIAMVSEHASPLAVIGGVDAGGQNVHVAELSGALVAQGHYVVVYTRRDDPGLPDRVTMPGGVIVEHVTAGPQRPLPKDDLFPLMDEFAVRLEHALLRDPVDLVHAHFWMSGYATARAASKLGLPFVQTFHALGTEKRRHQGAADTSPDSRIDHETAIARAADRIIATSSAEIFELCAMGADSRLLRIVPCGVNLSFFDKKRSAFRIPRRRKHRIVTLSRLVARKGIEDVLRALVDIPDTELLIGGGSDTCSIEDDPEAQRLSVLAAAAGIRDRVVFLGRVPRAQVPSLLRSADVVVCAPWYEPFGIVPLEAMASRVPVVASAVGGLRDTICDGLTGIHVPPRAPGAIACAVRTLLEHDETRRAFGARGRADVEARFTWTSVAEQTARVYETLPYAVPAAVERLA